MVRKQEKAFHNKAVKKRPIYRRSKAQRPKTNYKRGKGK